MLILEIQPYNAKAEADKKRAETDKAAYTGPAGGSKKPASKKTATKAKAV